MEYPVRDVAAFSSPPIFFASLLIHFCLNVSIHASLKVQPSRCCLMDVNNYNTLFLMRHRIKPQNASMGHVFQRLFFPRGLCQFTTSALGRNTRLCRKVTTVICALPSLYSSLGTWSPSVSAFKSILLPAATQHSYCGCFCRKFR